MMAESLLDRVHKEVEVSSDNSYDEEIESE